MQSYVPNMTDTLVISGVCLSQECYKHFDSHKIS